MRNITTPAKAVSFEDALRNLAAKLTGKPAASLPCTAMLSQEISKSRSARFAISQTRGLHQWMLLAASRSSLYHKSFRRQ